MTDRYYYFGTPAPPEEPAPPEASYIDNVLTLSPSALWGFQEASGNITDLSGNGWMATAVGGAITYDVTGPTIDGEALRGVSLPGSSSGYFTVANTLTDPSTGGFTLAAWVKHPNDAGIQSPFFWASSGQGTFWLRKGNGWGLDCALYNTVNGAFINPGISTLFDDTWIFIALRYDSSGTPTAKVWQGAETGTETATTGTWKRDGNPTCGIGANATSGTEYWNGELSVMGYWNTPLSDANVDKLRTGVF